VYYKIENKEILTKLFENWKKLDKKESKKFLSKFQKS
jgi:mRNA-degrading endonuclease RelE of RelBE toxin-antitoxin system